MTREKAEAGLFAVHERWGEDDLLKKPQFMLMLLRDHILSAMVQKQIRPVHPDEAHAVENAELVVYPILIAGEWRYRIVFEAKSPILMPNNIAQARGHSS